MDHIKIKVIASQTFFDRSNAKPSSKRKAESDELPSAVSTSSESNLSSFVSKPPNEPDSGISSSASESGSLSDSDFHSTVWGSECFHSIISGSSGVSSLASNSTRSSPTLKQESDFISKKPALDIPTSSIYHRCETCGNLFQSQDSVKKHIREIHSEINTNEGSEITNKGFTIVDYRSSDTDKYLNPMYGERHLVIRKSQIHGLGLYSLSFIPQGEIIVEYSGEIYHTTRCNDRQELYQKHSIDNYFLKNAWSRHVDATINGNCARYINNSCDPNCATEMMDIIGTTRVFIMTIKDILPGDELSFDYLFSSPELVPCLCKAANCKKFMNTIKDIRAKGHEVPSSSSSDEGIKKKKKQSTTQRSCPKRLKERKVLDPEMITNPMSLRSRASSLAGPLQEPN